jgi:hypothetical protein
LLLLCLGPVLEKLSPGMSILVWVLNCLQSLGIPQVNKELFSRVLSFSKEPILVPKLGVPNYFEDVKLPPDLPPILGNLEKGGVPSVLQLEMKLLVK